MFNGCDHSKEAGASPKQQAEKKPEAKAVSPAKSGGGKNKGGTPTK